MTDEASLDRDHLLNFQRERIEQYYLDYVRKNNNRPVVFVLDLRDEVGRGIGSALSDDATVEERIRQSVADGSIPTFLAAVPFRLAVDVLSRTMSEGAIAALKAERQQSGVFTVACVASGGTRLARRAIPS